MAQLPGQTLPDRKWYECVSCDAVPASNAMQLPCFHIVCSNPSCFEELNYNCSICSKNFNAKKFENSPEVVHLLNILNENKCCSSRKGIFCETCSVRFCDKCMMNHDKVPLFLTTHKKRAEAANQTRRETLNLFCYLVKEDINHLQSALKDLVDEEPNLKTELTKILASWQQLQDSTKCLGIDLTVEQRDSTMNKIKGAKSKIPDLKIYSARVAALTDFLEDYMDLDIHAFNTIYKNTLKNSLFGLIGEITSFLDVPKKTSKKTCAPEKSLNTSSVLGTPQQDSRQGQSRTSGPNMVAKKLSQQGAASTPSTANSMEKTIKKVAQSQRPTAAIYLLSEVQKLNKSQPISQPQKSAAWNLSSFSLSQSLRSERRKPNILLRAPSFTQSSSSTAPEKSTNSQNNGTVKKRGHCEEVPSTDDAPIPKKKLASSSQSSANAKPQRTERTFSASKCDCDNKKQPPKPTRKVWREDRAKNLELTYYKFLPKLEEHLKKHHCSQTGQEGCCAICIGGGDLVLCDGDKGARNCTKSFHMGFDSQNFRKGFQQCCHIPQIKDIEVPSETWQCFFCLDMTKLKNGSFLEEIKEVYTIPGSTGIYANPQTYFIACKFLSDVYNCKTSLVLRSRLASVCQKKGLPKPMTLTRIRDRLVNLTAPYPKEAKDPYTSILQIVTDLKTMIENAETAFEGQDLTYLQSFKENFETHLSKYQVFFKEHFYDITVGR